MSRLGNYFLIALFLNTWAGNELFSQVPGGAQTTGDWVARQAQDRDTGADARSTMRMRLVDRQGRVRERVLTTLSLKGGPGRAVPGDRSLTRFTYPNDINGTGFLVWEDPGGDDERFLYLPSLGRVRRIAGNETQDSFVGSDFTYEDIGGREFDDYTYALLDEASTWTAPDGTTHPAYRLESRSKSTAARFPRVVSLGHLGTPPVQLPVGQRSAIVAHRHPIRCRRGLCGEAGDGIRPAHRIRATAPRRRGEVGAFARAG
jgi:hypothetical protein